MKLKISNTALTLVLALLVVACQSDYTKLVKNELASGKKNDSVFHNLKFGQTKKDFYRICWDLNKQGIATHGPSNSYVQTILKPEDSTDVAKKIIMMFYAKFSPQDIITAMDVKFSYSAWAPWNDNLKADKLFPVVQDTLMKWYPGNPFIKAKNGAIVKVDGNRQIQIKQESDKDVSVVIEDLSYKLNNLNK